MIDRLLQNVVLRNKLMEIAEDVAPVIQSKKRNRDGEKCRYISVKTIDYTAQSMGEYTQYDVAVQFLSDIGDFIQPLIVKQYFSHSGFEDEISQHMRLTQRINHRSDVRILPAIHINEKELFICYEGSTGINLTDLNMDQALIDYLMGTVCAIFQGPQVQTHDLNNIVMMSEFLINQADFTERRKKKIAGWMRLHYYLLSKTKSGYFPLGILDNKSIWITFMKDISELTKSDIADLKPYQVDVLYVPPQITFNDRMIDIAMYIGEEAFQEFIDLGTIDQSWRRVLTFLEGYELEYDKDSYLPLEMLYPEGLTLDLNILIISWLFANQLIEDSSSRKEQKYLRNKLFKFAEHLLTTLPFKFYEDQEQKSESKFDDIVLSN